ncbi:MAG: dihydrolipoamide acetyltransferase family protein [Pseudomonadota bacterium]
MAIEVVVPLMGEGIFEATLVKWLKKPGDKVEKDEPLLEVSTDKVDTEIPAIAGGYVIALYAQASDVVLVDQVIAHIGVSPDEKVAAPVRSAPTKSPSPKPSSVAARPGQSAGAANKPSGPMGAQFSPQGNRPGYQTATVPLELAGTVRSSPLVRRMASEMGIDLRFVEGTGQFSRITKQDLQQFLSGGGSRIPTIEAVASSPESLVAQADMAPFRVKTRESDGVETLEGVGVRREPMTKMRKLIADHMVQSIRTSAHVTTTIEIDLEKIVQLRREKNHAFAERNGFKLTFTPFFLHAAIQAIKKDMIFNCSVDGYDILWKDDINLGCAVAIDEGLIVPVIKKAQDLSLTEIAGRLNDLALRARSKSLKPDEVKGGTFSVTNPGMFGCLVSTPIINQPQVAIMSVGGIIRRPVVIENDQIAIRSIASLGITFDHRVIDGQGGARFLSNIKNALESPTDLGI